MQQRPAGTNGSLHCLYGVFTTLNKNRSIWSLDSRSQQQNYFNVLLKHPHEQTTAVTTNNLLLGCKLEALSVIRIRPSTLKHTGNSFWSLVACEDRAMQTEMTATQRLIYVCAHTHICTMSRISLVRFLNLTVGGVSVCDHSSSFLDCLLLPY